ncbi:MAG TPA: Calx-beta domain-containing protein [Pyrinomonadaceae bacterium]|jgi:sugar lactone lactonase YvrE
MMYTNALAPRTRRRLALTLALALCANWLLPFASAQEQTPPAGEAQPEAAGDVQPLGTFVRRVPVVASDVVYNAADQTLYASVPSSAGAAGNTVTPINPATGEVGTPVFVGSEPSKLALSDDGHSLYVFLDGAYAVRRFDTQTRTPGTQFGVGSDSFHGVYRANDLAVAPGNPNLVAVARYYPGTSPPEAGVAVFDNGVQRTKTTPGHTDGANSLAFSATAAKLYGGGDQPLQTITVDATGATVTGTTTFVVGNQIKFAGGRVYSSSGQVVDPDAGTLLGTFAGLSGTTVFVPDPAGGRAYYLTRDFSGGATTLRAFDTNTFVLLGAETISGLSGDPTALVRWGTNGLAVRTNTNQLYLLQTSLIPSADPTPTPTPTPAATPTPTPTPTPQTFVQQLPLAANDVTYNPADQTLYASVPSSAGAAGNTVTPINPATGEVGTPVFVGSEPNKLALADDGHTLYVTLAGASAIRRFDTLSRAAGAQFPLGTDSFYGAYQVNDLSVAPGNPNVVAVARFYAGISPPEAGVAVFDNGVQRTKTGPGHIDGSDYVAFSATETKLYGGGGFGGLRTMTVDATGVASYVISSLPVGGRIKFANGLIFGGGGQVVNPDAGQLLGTFSGVSTQAFAPDPAAGRVYFLTRDFSTNGLTLKAFDLNTFVLLGSTTLAGISGDPTTLTRWGTNGLAFRTSTNQLYLIRTSLISAADPIPPPTPTPSPTPTPTPTYIPTFVRKVDLQANDLVYNPATQALYASVPSTAANGAGNSITSVDPQTSVVGPSTFVGSEPGKLALADDGQTLYVNLKGAGAVRRFDIPTRTPGAQFNVGVPEPVDMEVVPGSPQSLAVSRGVFFNGSVAIYDNGVQRPNVSQGNAYAILPIEFGASPATLYGYDSYSSGFELVKFQVDASGVRPLSTTNNLISGYNSAFEYADGRLFSGGGRVVDPETKTLLGTFNGGGQLLAVDASVGRAFYLSSNFGSGPVTLSAFDINTFLPVGSITLPSISGTPNNLVRWGPNGLAFSTLKTSSDSSSTSQVYLIQSALVSNAGTIPSTLQFSLSSYSVNEFSNSATVTVTRMGSVAGAATVDYATSDGTATAGSDYTATAGTLTFAAGELSKTFTVPLIDDSVFEGNETINLTLSNPTGGTTLAAPQTAVLTIQDNEFTPFLSVSSVSVIEGDTGQTDAVFNLTLSNATTRTVTLNYATAPAGATADVDYVSTSGTLTFAPLERTKQITVRVNGDVLQESNETFALSLTNIVNTSSSTAQGFCTIVDDDAPGIRFATSAYSAGEGDARATLTVTRKGDATTSATVDYRTIDLIANISCADTQTRPGVAFARCDYATTVDTLTFAPGETSKTLTIPLVDDAHVEGNELVQVVLTNSTGEPLGSPSAVFLTIVDNDTAVGPNPVFTTPFFVRQHYLDFLSREPEQGEPWSNVLNNCSDVNSNPACDRLTVSAAFFGSPEFRLKGFYAFLFYKVGLGRLPTYDEIIFDMRQVTGQTADEVYAKRARFADSFAQRQAFTVVYGTMTNTDFVANLLAPYGLAAITTADPAHPDTGAQVTLTQAQLVAGLTNNTLTRAQVLRAIVESREVGEREFNNAFVAMQYYGYLRRSPDQTGYNSWLNYLNTHPGDFRTMVNGFMNSTEYRLRFGVQNP